MLGFLLVESYNLLLITIMVNDINEPKYLTLIASEMLYSIGERYQTRLP